MPQLQISVNVTNDDTEVTIPGALVAADIDEGDLFKVYSQNGGQGIYHVGSVAEVGGDTIVTLTAPYQGVDASGVTGIFHRDFTAEQGYPLMSDGDLDAAAILSRMAAEMDEDFQGVLYDSVLAQNGGTVPEENRENHFRENQVISASEPLVLNRTDGTGTALRFRREGGTISTIDNSTIWTKLKLQTGIRFEIEGGDGVSIGSVSPQGEGTLNAEELYENGNRVVTDYVFDAELDGDVDTAHYDALMGEREIDEGEDEYGNPKVRREKQTHRPAHAFRENTSELEPTEFAKRWRKSRKLPAMERCESSLRDGQERPSLGQTLQAVLETCEVQAVHIDRLEKRIKELEKKIDKV